MFEKLKEAMSKIGITGMTVTNILGCGMQKRHPDVQGARRDINLLPKVKVKLWYAKARERRWFIRQKRIIHRQYRRRKDIYIR
jgi:nitrogen regulatory protein PII